MTLEELLEQPKYKAANIRSQIMAMMLNGTIGWDEGCFIRNHSDEYLIEYFEEHTELN